MWPIATRLAGINDEGDAHETDGPDVADTATKVQPYAGAEMAATMNEPLTIQRSSDGGCPSADDPRLFSPPPMLTLPLPSVMQSTTAAFAIVAAAGMLGVSSLPARAQGVPMTPAERVTSLEAQLVPVRSISPADTMFDDLAPIAAKIGDARIVMLGETSHGDANTFLAKTRLVRFLHERHGFDVLAFESGLYDAAVTWDSIRAGGDPTRAVRGGLHGVWSLAAEFEPLTHYLAARATSGRPLEVSGFDMRFSGSGASTQFTADLRRVLRRYQLDTTALRGWPTFAAMLDSLAAGRYTRQPPPAAAQAEFLATFAAVRAALDRASSDDAELRFWRQVLTNTERNAREYVFAVDAPNASTNARDAQMAANFLWLMRERVAGRKVIVWGATAHLARGETLTGMPSGDHAGFVSLGDHLGRALGSQVYTIGFVSTEGTVSLGSFGIGARPLPQPSAEGLDGMLGATRHEYAFLDLARQPADSWLRLRLRSETAYRYGGATGSWPAVLDGIFYIRRQAVTTRSAR